LKLDEDLGMGPQLLEHGGIHFLEPLLLPATVVLDRLSWAIDGRDVACLRTSRRSEGTETDLDLSPGRRECGY
jgi:hypothetical protein